MRFMLIKKQRAQPILSIDVPGVVKASNIQEEDAHPPKVVILGSLVGRRQEEKETIGLFFFGHACGIQKSPNPCRSSDQSHGSYNGGSSTC